MSTGKCAPAATQLSCSASALCVRNALECVNGAIDGVGCTSLQSLRVALFSFSSAAVVPAYRGSALESSCLAASCSLLSGLSSGSCATSTNYGLVCRSPLTKAVKVTVSGSFAAMFVNDSATSTLKASLAADLGALANASVQVEIVSQSPLQFTAFVDPAGLSSTTTAALSSTLQTALTLVPMSRTVVAVMAYNNTNAAFNVTSVVVVTPDSLIPNSASTPQILCLVWLVLLVLLLA